VFPHRRGRAQDDLREGILAVLIHYVVLVHGFLRRGRNMRFLAGELERRGYQALTPDLPTTFRNAAACAGLLSFYLDERLSGERVVHFVGHSMGGLVIREYLSRRVVAGLGRVVLIGSPNRGSRHGSRALLFPLLRRVFQSLPDLAEPGPHIVPPLNDPPPQVGVVVGTWTDVLRRPFLQGEHDGLVTAESARAVPACDEIQIPCSHERLHWRQDTAEAIDLFLRTGKFRKR
jgi:pimeloyl-ACP methyl ester carboxylesterase